jgi:L-methionine (R)-S-oxide reductase
MSDDDHDSLLPPPLPLGATAETKRAFYASLLHTAQVVLGAGDGDVDAVGALSTLAFLLSRSLPFCSWAGFYRRAADRAGQQRQPHLVVGPYVSATSMGCLNISYSRGVCGAAARERETQVVPDVSQFAGHIACSSSTQSEIVVPVFEDGDRDGGGEVVAVLDLDSVVRAAFDADDAAGLEALCAWLGRAFYTRDWERRRGEERRGEDSRGREELT